MADPSDLDRVRDEIDMLIGGGRDPDEIAADLRLVIEYCNEVLETMDCDTPDVNE